MEAKLPNSQPAKRLMFAKGRAPEPNLVLKRLLWLYFALLIIEGALRKWVLPQYSGPLLIVRDPVVLLIYFRAHRDGLFRRSPFLSALSVLAVASLFLLVVQSLMLKIPATVLAYGFRTDFLHLPLIFLIPSILGKDDLLRLGKWVLLAAIPMALLMAYQFQSSPAAWINRTPGTGGGTQLIAALGKIRPPGTFSFVTGPVSFFALVTAVLLHGLKGGRGNYSRLLLVGAGLAVTLALAVSGSRGALIGVGIVLIAWLLGLTAAKQIESSAWRMVILAAIIVAVMAQVDLFKEGAEVMTTRWEMATESERAEGGMIGRVLRTLVAPIEMLPSIPILGSGLGVGTNVGATLLTGQAQFLLSEGEWGRIVLEMGPVLGGLFILFRIGLVLWLARQCLRCAMAGNVLPMLLFSACATSLLTGQIAQPTTLGFTTFVGGLCLAAIQLTPLPDRMQKRSGRKSFTKPAFGEAALAPASAAPLRAKA